MDAALYFFLQRWFNLSDLAVEESLYDSASMRQFVGIDRGRQAAPRRPALRAPCKTAACLVEDNLMGEEYYHHFVENCERLKSTSPPPKFMSREDAVALLYRLRQTNAESLCYVGYGGLTQGVSDPERHFSSGDGTCRASAVRRGLQ